MARAEADGRDWKYEWESNKLVIFCLFVFFY